jgi:tetratricopeptide (TPR) repeat protein
MTTRNRVLTLLLLAGLAVPAWANEQEEAKARQALADGHPQVARQWLERLVNRQPERMDLRAAYANSLYQLGEVLAAERQIEEVLATQPNQDIDTLILGIDIYRALGNWGKAQALLQQATSKPEVPPALYLRQANVLEAIGREAEANAAMMRYRSLIQPTTTEGAAQ